MFDVRRRKAEACGRLAEQEVAARWRAQGFTVLAQRMRTKSGEIDLVVADATTLVFVEVKARKSFTEAAYAVQPRQQARLLEAASAALAENADWERPDTRFDVALVCNGAIQHIPDAIRYF
jgi:putative endonuclease